MHRLQNMQQSNSTSQPYPCAWAEMVMPHIVHSHTMLCAHQLGRWSPSFPKTRSIRSTCDPLFQRGEIHVRLAHIKPLALANDSSCKHAHGRIEYPSACFSTIPDEAQWAHVCHTDRGQLMPSTCMHPALLGLSYITQTPNCPLRSGLGDQSVETYVDCVNPKLQPRSHACVLIQAAPQPLRSVYIIAPRSIAKETRGCALSASAQMK